MLAQTVVSEPPFPTPHQMPIDDDAVDVGRLVEGLLRAGHELEWVEFKQNNDDPNEIGRNISAVANAAALHGERLGFVVWGIEDVTNKVVGTNFNPKTARKSNQLLEMWLTTHLSPRVDFRFFEGQVDGNRVVVLQVPRATVAPISFEKEEWIRIGSSTTKLHGNYDKQRQLWHNFTRTSFENGVALADVPPKNVLALLKYETYFKLRDLPVPSGEQAIVAVLEEENFIRRNPTGGYDITNLGAISFAKNLKPLGLDRKAVRVVIYSGNSRYEPAKERIVGRQGYAAGFEGLLGYLNALLPSSDAIGTALRKNVPLYPPLAVRELVANALVHQDFSLTGTGPLIEVFTDRLEITNPGRPLIDPLRFLDAPPHSRNERLAWLLRRMGICEELGTGIDKVVWQAEAFQLPPPDFRVSVEHTAAILYAPRPFAHMDRNERIRATYQHACLKYVSHGHLTNSSLRERFGISAANSAIASRIIGEAIEAGRIVPDDQESQSKRHARYVPFWARVI